MSEAKSIKATLKVANKAYVALRQALDQLPEPAQLNAPEAALCEQSLFKAAEELEWAITLLKRMERMMLKGELKIKV